MVYKFFDKKSASLAASETLTTRATQDNSTSKGAVKNGNMSNQELAEEFHKLITTKTKKRKLHSTFIDNIWVTDLGLLIFISKFNKGIRFLLYVIDILSKNRWVFPLKDKKGITVTNVFQKILDESNRKPNKICVDKGSEFYNRSMKSWIEKNDIEIYSTDNAGKSVVPERFTLKNKIYKYITSISKKCILINDIV